MEAAAAALQAFVISSENRFGRLAGEPFLNWAVFHRLLYAPHALLQGVKRQGKFVILMSAGNADPGDQDSP